jgi:hypothetical protein
MVPVGPTENGEDQVPKCINPAAIVCGSKAEYGKVRYVWRVPFVGGTLSLMPYRDTKDGHGID